MSGIEVAGLAIGAIPVILEAIKLYGETQGHIHDFKHASKHIRLVDAQFRVCRLNFLSECRLLLELVLFDPHLSQQMVHDPQHGMWQERDIEHQLADLLRENADACTVIVSDTTATLQNFATRLGRLQIPTVSQFDGSIMLRLTILIKRAVAILFSVQDFPQVS